MIHTDSQLRRLEDGLIELDRVSADQQIHEIERASHAAPTDSSISCKKLTVTSMIAILALGIIGTLASLPEILKNK